MREAARRLGGARLRALALGLGLALGGLAACGGGAKPAEICLSIEASDNLNLFSGDPHVVVVYFYPLQNVLAFRQTDAGELLDGKQPPGMMGDRFEITVFPGTQREVSEALPGGTQFVGILADFYNGPSTAVVEAGCSMFGGATVVLSSSDIQVR